ncbi:MAG: hypothetical protein ACTHZN_03855 [Canibacter sp.]
MSDSTITPPLGYVPDPLQPHRVVIEFDVLARSQAEADYMVGEVLVEELAGEPDDIRTDGSRVFGEGFGDDVASITSWTPVTGTPEVPPRQVIIPSRGWEPFEETGIPEIVAEMFPPEPHTESFRFPDGSPDTDRFDDAHEQWRDECLSLAIQASRLPDTLTKLERAERVRDGLIDLVEREQLPVEPVKEDYLVTIAPAYEGEFEDMRFAWDHGAWHTEFTALAKRREHALHGLLAEGGPRTMILPERFHREWLPADLIAIQTLRTLVEREKTGQGVSLLDRRQREQLEAMLFAADPDVRIIDPADPDRGELYAGRASEAHDWVPPGVYDAVGLEGTGEFRVVVGRMPVGDGMTASAAFSPVEHDSAVLNEIARILEHNTEHHAPDEVLRQVNAQVLTTGRIGAAPEHSSGVSPEPPMTRLEQGVLLSEFLADREQHLDPDPEDPERPSPDTGIGRDL